MTRFVTTCTWSDVPHLSEQDKADLLSSIPPFQRDARSKGIPSLGSGAIYPVPETDIIVDDFQIPDDWRKCYGMDVGWNRTAVAWLAHDPDTDIVYMYSEHYMGGEQPAVHASAIKGRGIWIKGVIDPASRGRTQNDGIKLIDQYRDQGLNLSFANNAVEAGIYAVWERLSSGRLKIFRSCKNFLGEYRTYRRDEKGRIVKSNDHLCDGLRYGIMSGLPIAKEKNVDNYKGIGHNTYNGEYSWLS